MLIGGGCTTVRPTSVTPVTSTPEATTASVPAAAISSPDDPRVLKQLAIDWRRDSDLYRSGSGITADGGISCLGVPQKASPQAAALVPDTYKGFFSRANHACSQVVRVFIGCDHAAAAGVYDGTNGVNVDGQAYYCNLGWRERLVLEDLKTGVVQTLGDLEYQSGSNWGGLEVPFGFTKDDRQLLLEPWMGSPGAGGSSVSLGHQIMPATGAGATAQAQLLAPDQVVFYDGNGKMVYLDNSDRLPSYSQPGPRINAGTVKWKDLTTGQERTLLEEKDTSYQLDGGISRDGKTLQYTAIKHRFTSDCPRVPESLSCSQKTSSQQTLVLP